MQDRGAGKVKPRLVFVHGIGGSRDPGAELALWKRHLADGFRAAGHGGEISALTMDWAADSSFAYYGDLFADPGAQGGDGPGLDEEETRIALGLLAALLDEEATVPENLGDPALRRVRAQIDAQTDPKGRAQGGGAVAAALWGWCTAVARIPGIAGPARWTAGREVFGMLSQPSRYLRRGGHDQDGRSLDRRIRDRVLECLDRERPAVVIAHSLGSVVALEALAEYDGPVPLFVTIGSPIAMPAFVLPLLRPAPPATPACVERWLDFGDGDDVVVPAFRPRLADVLQPNERGVLPTAGRLTSRRWWVHSATTYLARPEVAGPVAEALAGRAAAA